ncbi:uncharacterized protein LOC111636628 [Centruroides sculpturatus]|uniref:uncharacterized protein LOC111636628 n=1 Tax=Centruroides sculpturatus TaxID=218467 RepID=UPI000C6E3FFB|nr:uncharacterized protein LOC111636628 [Centruroides sculpturatus]
MRFNAFECIFILLLLKNFVVFSKETKTVGNSNNETIEEYIKTSLENAEKRIKGYLRSLNKATIPYMLRIAEEVKISTSCQTSGIRFLKDLMQLKPWTLKMLDAFGKPSAGALRGSNWIRGDYDQCLLIDSTEDKETTIKNSKNIRGKFCYIGVNGESMYPKVAQIVEQKNNSIIKLIQHFIEPLKLSHIKLLFETDIQFWIDVCIPSTCSKDDLQNILAWATGDNSMLCVKGCKERNEERIYSTSQIICLYDPPPPPPE